MKIKIKLLAKPEFVAGKKGDVEVQLATGEFDYYVDVAELELHDGDRVERAKLTVARNNRHHRMVVSS